jgi:hypothetical protein
MFGINLPDFKGSLNEAFQTYVQAPLEAKANEIKQEAINKATEFQVSNNHFQQAIIAILFASFCVGVIAITFKE